jgi:hypothetical protein
MTEMTTTRKSTPTEIREESQGAGSFPAEAGSAADRLPGVPLQAGRLIRFNPANPVGISSFPRPRTLGGFRDLAGRKRPSVDRDAADQASIEGGVQVENLGSQDERRNDPELGVRDIALIFGLASGLWSNGFSIGRHSNLPNSQRGTLLGSFYAVLLEADNRCFVRPEPSSEFASLTRSARNESSPCSRRSVAAS